MPRHHHDHYLTTLLSAIVMLQKTNFRNCLCWLVQNPPPDDIEDIYYYARQVTKENNIIQLSASRSNFWIHHSGRIGVPSQTATNISVIFTTFNKYTVASKKFLTHYLSPPPSRAKKTTTQLSWDLHQRPQIGTFQTQLMECPCEIHSIKCKPGINIIIYYSINDQHGWKMRCIVCAIGSIMLTPSIMKSFFNQILHNPYNTIKEGKNGKRKQNFGLYFNLLYTWSYSSDSY